MEKYTNSGHPTAHFAKLGQQPNNLVQLMPRLPPLNPQFKLSKKITPFTKFEYQHSKSWVRPCVVRAYASNPSSLNECSSYIITHNQ
jgi:hypothetical protein